MSIQLQDVQVLDNPASFTSNFKFRITFDCVSPGIKHELEWKLVYVGSADNEDNDQTLDQILVGPVRVGKNRFTFEAPAPNPTKIPESDLLDVTVILLTCSYSEQEFIRIGYYVHNEYDHEIDENNENVQIKPQNIMRNILADKPRVTRFNIEWDNNDTNNKNKKLDEDVKSNEENNNQYQAEQQQQVDDDDVEEEEEEEEEDENFEEDLADTEEMDNKTSDINGVTNGVTNDNQTQNNNKNKFEEDDDDIDMTE